MTEPYIPNDRSIQFTQYLLPNGRTITQLVERDGELLEKARAIESAGFVFESEMLRDFSTVSFEVLHGVDREDSIAHQLVANGPAVVGAIDKLITDAYAEIHKRASR